MKKKILALALAALSVCLMLTGCMQTDIGIKMNKNETGSIAATLGIEEDFYEQLKESGNDPFDGKSTVAYEYDGETYIGYTETKDYKTYEDMEKALLEMTYRTDILDAANAEDDEPADDEYTLYVPETEKTDNHMQVRLKLFFEWGIIFPKEIYTVPDKGNRTVSYARQAVLEQNINIKYHPRSAGDKMTQEEIDDREEKFEISQKSPRKNTQDKSKKKNGKPTGDKKTGAPCAHSIPMSESNLPPVERDAIIINEKGEECDASALERV